MEPGLARTWPRSTSSRLVPLQEHADVVAGLALVEELSKHLDAGDDGLDGGLDADDLDFIADLDDAALDSAGDDGAAAGDGEHVFDGHEERAVDGALGLGDVGVEGVGQFHDRGFAELALVAFEGLQGAADDDRGLVAGEAVLGEQVADFFLDEFEQVLVVDLVGFVQIHDDVGDADLARQENMFAGLGHGAVGGRHHQDRAVHLGGAGDHVLDVVGVARAVDVGVVALRRSDTPRGWWRW